MSSITAKEYKADGTEDISLDAEDVQESRMFVRAQKTIVFKHEATAGQLEIDLTALTTPSEALANGFVQPTSPDLAAANLLLNKKNFTLHSSRGVMLQQYEDFIITGSMKIRFIGTIESLGGALIGEVFTGSVVPVPANNVLVADARRETLSYTLTVGSTLLNLGKEYNVGKNLLLSSQVGEIKVYRNGALQMRNVSNATAAPAADGNYQEIDSGSGVGTTITFNNAPVGQDDAVIVEFGMDMAGDIAISGNLDALYGAILKLADDVKDLGPYSISRYISANPSQVERRGFGDSVLSALARIGVLEAPVNLHCQSNNVLLSTSGSNASALYTGNSIVLTTGRYLLHGFAAIGPSGIPQVRSIAAQWHTSNGNNASALASLPALVPSAGLNNERRFQGVSGSVDAGFAVTLPPFEYRVNGTQTVFLNSAVDFSVAGSSVQLVYGFAQKISPVF